MKFDAKKWLSGLLVLSSVLQTPMMSHAQIISDLPNPDEDFIDFNSPPPPATVNQNVQTVQTGWTMLEKISRRTGGDLFTVKLENPLPLMRLEVRVDQSKVDVLETTLITNQGRRISVRELTRTGVLERGTTRSSENLNLQDVITAIEVRMESHSAEATVLFSALSDYAYPRLKATRAEVQTPQAPMQPPAPTRPTAPSAPAPKPTAPSTNGSSLVFSKGDIVLSNGKYTGVIVAVNRDGSFQIRDNDDGKIYTRQKNDVVKFVSQSANGVYKAGVNVLSSGKYEGVVVGVYSDGKVLVRDKDDGKEYSRNQSELATEVQCDRSGMYCVGTLVLSSGRYKGKVTKVYSSGLILVRDEDDGKNYARSAGDLRIRTLPTSCDNRGNNCKGTKVISNGKYFGVVVGYNDGKIMVRDNDDGKVYDRELSSVAFEISCSAEGIYCKGRRVLSSGKYAGTVVSAYSDGVIMVQDDDDGKSYPRKASDLAYEIKCAANNICAGSRVRAGNYTGKVIRIYSNKVVDMRDDDDGKIYARQLSTLVLLKK